MQKSASSGLGGVVQNIIHVEIYASAHRSIQLSSFDLQYILFINSYPSSKGWCNPNTLFA
jgi:hypothetical protein